MYYFNVLFFAILTIVIVGSNAGTTRSCGGLQSFSRKCQYDSDCDFGHPDMGTPVFLTCRSGKCQCANPANPIMDVAFYTVRIEKNVCVVKYTAPCGVSNGLKLVCDTGMRCIENRCRSGVNIQPINYSCDEDIDCQTGLKCIMREGEEFPSKYCQ